ncbi:MAG: UvrD-helicase domain-containing protein, partial [Chloroflexi bacterium]|nr:UvrD-helicase domain-containing protein [Chloroflexota bacterium]
MPRSVDSRSSSSPMYSEDQRARQSIVDDLGSNLFVEAGAGTGKTTALVSRVVSLIAEGTPLTKLVVITFTRAAAAELRERVRRELASARD